MAQDNTEKKKAVKVKRPTALKRDLQHEKSRLRNRMFRSKVKTAIRRFDESLEKGDANTMNTELSAVYSLMDKGVKLGVYKINTASRTKARLHARQVKTAAK